jgi:hypothetical protein
MTQANLLTRTRVTYVGLESTFGSVPSTTFPNVMTKGVFKHDTIEIDPQVEMLEVGDERLRREDAIQPVHGLQIATKISGLAQYLKVTPSANQLTSSGATGSLTPRVMLKAAFGAEHAAVGTTVNDAAATATSFIVTSASTLKKGDWIAVTISGQPEVTKITNIASTTVTVSPALSAGPADGAVVRNLYNYCPAESHTTSMTIYRGWRDLAASDVTCEYIFNGVYGDIAFKFPGFGQLATMEFSGTAASFTGPAASGSIDTATTVVDEMGAAIVWKPSIYLATSVDRTTRLVCESAEFGHANAWQMVRDGGAASTVNSVVNTGGRPGASTAKIVVRYDNAHDVAFDADTAYQMILVLQAGTGSTASFWIFELPNCKLVSKPKLTNLGDRVHMELNLRGYQDSSVTVASETGDDLSRCLATARVAFG